MNCCPFLTAPVTLQAAKTQNLCQLPSKFFIREFHFTSYIYYLRQTMHSKNGKTKRYYSLESRKESWLYKRAFMNLKEEKSCTEHIFYFHLSKCVSEGSLHCQIYWATQCYKPNNGFSCAIWKPSTAPQHQYEYPRIGITWPWFYRYGSTQKTFPYPRGRFALVFWYS